jgi:hypothetical protein
MLTRPKFAGLFIALVTGAALLLAGCSSSSPRDMSWGTDVAVGYVPPDAGATTTVDAGASEAAASEAAASEAAASEAAIAPQDTADSANAGDGGLLDGEVTVDVAIGGDS